MAEITGQIKISEETSPIIQKKIDNILNFKKEIENNLTRETTQILEIILGGAANLNSSDIHFEPEKEKAKIRIRVDGILRDIIYLDPKIYSKIVSRIKLISGIKLNVADRPQDGRFSLILKESPVEIRTSTLPSEYGESIVLRVLNPKNLIELADLGLRNDLLKIFEKEAKKPHGMIIVTGPTGSGKTSTLYAFLKKISGSETKIITIEDPIEYHLKGISQTQAEPSKGYDFANGLRSLMRQDPDVILVGEIRDFETAQIALQAALTGHLVLSTLHANDAAGTVSRLVDLGVSSASIAPAVNMIVAQRLVRKICEKCKKEAVATAEELAEFEKNLNSLPKNVKIRPLTKDLKIPKTKGCEFCNFTGYSGRMGVHEALLINSDMEKLILASATTAELRETAIKKGMIAMYQDGLIKVLKGITSLEEVKRVVGEEE